MQIAFSAVLPRRENRFSSLECQRSQSAEIQALNDRYRDVNWLLQELCHKEGFVFIGDLVDEWDRWIGYNGVHPSRDGNKVLAGFLFQHARKIAEMMTRSRIDQDHLERTSNASPSWNCWTTKDVPFNATCEIEFPPLVSSCPPTAPASPPPFPPLAGSVPPLSPPPPASASFPPLPLAVSVPPPPPPASASFPPLPLADSVTP
ncbi:unnamed protein product, partial [Ixodes hexagonus]